MRLLGGESLVLELTLERSQEVRLVRPPFDDGRGKCEDQDSGKQSSVTRSMRPRSTTRATFLSSRRAPSEMPTHSGAARFLGWLAISGRLDSCWQR